MNFVGHIEVARRHLRDRAVQGDEAKRFLLGAALPDLAAIGRFRLLDRPADPAVAAGVDFHHRTDEAFHRHHWFRTNDRALADRLRAAGVPNGACRACGHVGVELLLDGELLGADPDLRRAAQVSIESGADRGEELAALVDPDRRADWRHHLEQLARWTVPDDYHHPPAVAYRLQRILARRPRLAFDRDRIDDVAGALRAQQEAVVAGAADLLGDLEQSLEHASDR